MTENFSDIHVTCPHCGETNVFQSRYLSGEMIVYCGDEEIPVSKSCGSGCDKMFVAQWEAPTIWARAGKVEFRPIHNGGNREKS